jgi:hypothetical protein
MFRKSIRKTLRFGSSFEAKSNQIVNAIIAFLADRDSTGQLGFQLNAEQLHPRMAE